MSWFLQFYRSALGKKAIMAVTGLVLFGFVLIHMLGNLKLYYGPGNGAEPAAINEYGEWLREVGHPLLPHEGALWMFRIVLLGAVALHIWSAAEVTKMSWQARPVKYHRLRKQASTYASRTMRWGGVIVALFIVYHLAHFTLGPKWAHHDFIPGDVYHNVVAGFRVWWVSAFYIVAQLLLGLHLYHGLWSMFQSLGWNHPPYNLWRRRFAQTFAALITLGNISFPVSVLAGWVS